MNAASCSKSMCLVTHSNLHFRYIAASLPDVWADVGALHRFKSCARAILFNHALDPLII